jgi:hypothetical protein
MRFWHNSEFTILRACVQYASRSRIPSFLLLFSFFWIVAAASHSGFIGKWALCDQDPGCERYGIEPMLDGTAAKPWIYRQLAPIVANVAEKLIPNETKEYFWQNLQSEAHSSEASKLGPEKTFTEATTAAKPQYRFRYIVVYYLSFLSVFLVLFVLREVLVIVGAERMSAIIAPTSFVLAHPYLQTGGGYYYDNIEVLFLSMALLFGIRGNINFIDLDNAIRHPQQGNLFLFPPGTLSAVATPLLLEKGVGGGGNGNCYCRP